jgi:hypothetical protein
MLGLPLLLKNKNHEQIDTPNLENVMAEVRIEANNVMEELQINP